MKFGLSTLTTWKMPTVVVNSHIHLFVYDGEIRQQCGPLRKKENIAQTSIHNYPLIVSVIWDIYN